MTEFFYLTTRSYAYVDVGLFLLKRFSHKPIEKGTVFENVQQLLATIIRKKQTNTANGRGPRGFHWKRRDNVGPTGTGSLFCSVPSENTTGKHTHKIAVSEWPRPCSAAHSSPRSSPPPEGRPGPPPGSVPGDVGPLLPCAQCLPTPPSPSPPPPPPPAVTAPTRNHRSYRSSRSSR
jgi:hypothetical protein